MTLIGLPRPARDPRSCFLRPLAFAALGLAAVAAPQTTDADLPHDDLKGRFQFWDVAPMQPLLAPPGGRMFYVLNQPGGRLATFSFDTGARLNEVPTGPGLVSMELTPDGRELWLVDRVTSSVSVLQVEKARIKRSIRVGAGPHGIAFSESGDRAYVACSDVDRVDVIDTRSYQVVNSIDIPARHPRAVQRVGDRVFVASFLSGNGTAPIARPGESGEVRHVDELSNTTPLPDRDLFVIRVGPSAADDALDPTATVTELGTVLFNAHRRPGTSEIWIPNFDSLNGRFRGDRSFLAGQVVQNRVTVYDAATGTTNVLDLDSLAPDAAQRASSPTGIAFTSDGSRAFVCGFGADTVAVLDVQNGSATWAGVIRVRARTNYPELAGPRAALVVGDDEYLITYNFGDNTFSRISLAALPSGTGFEYTAPIPTRLGFDPLPLALKRGRVLFNRTQNSLSNTSSCFSCHVDGDRDGLAWELSRFLDPEGTPSDHLQFGLDVKGPMVTQSVRRLAEVSPYHWRGEMHRLRQFDSATTNLLERHVNGDLEGMGSDFFYLTQYLEELSLLPNPYQPLDRRYTPEQLEGADLFLNKPVQGNLTCVDCHTLPLGSSGEIVPSGRAGPAPTINVPALRGLFDKLSRPFYAGGRVGRCTELGAGLGHDGSLATVGALLRDAPGGTRLFDVNAVEAEKLEVFLKALDTGLAPATGFQVTAHSGNAASVAAGELAFLVEQAEAGNCDLVFQTGPARFRGQSVYLTGAYDPAAGVFRHPSDTLADPTPADLIAKASTGHPITFVGLPIGMGPTLGHDYDNDGIRNLDERILGTNPENHDSDEDGFPDGHEVLWQTSPLQPNPSSPDDQAPSLAGPVRVVYVTQTAIKLEVDVDEPVRASFLRDGVVTLRRPLGGLYDTSFSVVLNGLQAGRTHQFAIELTDPAGNSTVAALDHDALPRALPAPVHVERIDLSVVPGGGPHPDTLHGAIQLLQDDSPPMPGYGVRTSVFWLSAFGALELIEPLSPAWSSGTDGTASFAVDVPSSIPAGTGVLITVVQNIEAPAGGAAYVEAKDKASFQVLPY